MLEKYHCNTTEEYKNALKEIIQEIALLGFSRAGLFKEAAFYGGTALRIFYGLDRFSEDLDFSLLTPNPEFQITPYCHHVQQELASFGFEMEVSRKEKRTRTLIESAFIKGNTLVHLLQIESINPPVAGVHPLEKFKIKLEIDCDPPPKAQYEIKYGLSPIPYSARLFKPSSLFAGKLHALLCRNWQHRIKGRDMYDFVWYLSRDIPVYLPHLEERMRQTGHLKTSEDLSEMRLREILQQYFDTINISQAQKDVEPFLSDPGVIELWSRAFFHQITHDKLRVEPS
jgi:predicted nucleotidyltransferase component of viral defense system